jgi:pimeloyl-ACP methyl ester carboxylesterase
MMFKATFLTFSLLVHAPTAAPDRLDFMFEQQPLAGTWESATDRYYVTYWGESPYLIRAADGKAFQLKQPDPEKPEYTFNDLGGTGAEQPLSLIDEDSWSVTPDDLAIRPARRVRFPAEHIVVRNGEDAELHGTIIWPEVSRPKGVIIYLSGEGPNPRTEMLPTALALLDNGFAAVIFDQRHAGVSTGKANKGRYHQRSLVAASDATAVTQRITADPRFARLSVGVLGWSQGGWIGAIVSRNNPDLDFYINVAGNAAPGWRQWRHSMISRLIRSDVKQADLADAKIYFDHFFGVMHGEKSWDSYLTALEVAREQIWWPIMKRRNFAEWESESEASDYAVGELKNVPANDFREVTVPSLGLFFEFDGSSSPESPGIFAAALSDSKASSFEVIQMPGLQHGSWVVNGYADSASRFSTRDQEVNKVIANWLVRNGLHLPRN